MLAPVRSEARPVGPRNPRPAGEVLCGGRLPSCPLGACASTLALGYGSCESNVQQLWGPNGRVSSVRQLLTRLKTGQLSAGRFQGNTGPLRAISVSGTLAKCRDASADKSPSGPK